MKRYRYLAVALGAVLLLLAGNVQAQRRAIPVEDAGDDLEQIAESSPRTNDAVYLDNGDRISGTILRLDDGMLTIAGELVEDETRVPLTHVTRALFRTPEEVPASPGDRLIVANGDRLSVIAHGLERGVLAAATGAGDAVHVETERLTGIIFERKPYVIYENDFDSDDLKGLKPMSGTWAIEKGELVQKERNASFSTAALEVAQDGRFQYAWTANLASGYTYGFYFFADNGESVHGGTSYFILVQGRSIYLYKVRNDNQQYYANCTLSNRNRRAAFQLDYDPADGHILLTIDGKDAFRYRDPKPIQSGRYVILRVDSVGNFDDLMIQRLGGGPVLATEAKARGRDIVSLLNTDEVSGIIMGMDDETILMKTDYDEDPVDIQRTYVSSVTFYRQAARVARSGSVHLTLVNGDSITGRLAELDEEKVVIDTEVFGQLTFPRPLLSEFGTGEPEGEAVGGLHNEPRGGPKVGVILIDDGGGEF